MSVSQQIAPEMSSVEGTRSEHHIFDVSTFPSSEDAAKLSKAALLPHYTRLLKACESLSSSLMTTFMVRQQQNSVFEDHATRLNNTTTQLNNTTTQLNTVQQENILLRKKTEEIQAKYDELLKEHKKLTLVYQHAQTDFNKTVEGLETKIDKLETKLAAHDEKANRQQAELDAADLISLLFNYRYSQETEEGGHLYDCSYVWRELATQFHKLRHNLRFWRRQRTTVQQQKRAGQKPKRTVKDVDEKIREIENEMDELMDKYHIPRDVNLSALLGTKQSRNMDSNQPTASKQDQEKLIKGIREKFEYLSNDTQNALTPVLKHLESIQLVNMTVDDY